MIARDTGRMGEELACRYLKKNGYKILERNFRKKFGEIDIVAQIDDFLCFIEVKTRKNSAYGLPCEFVTHSKRQKIIRTAYTYINEKHYDGALRFDVVEVLSDEQGKRALRHIPHAFTL